MYRCFPLALLTVSLTLASCGGNTTAIPPTTEPAATTGTINGVRIVDANTYEFGFTPLKGSEIVGKATLTAATVTQLSAGAATASVCGNVVGQDVITATVSLDSTGSMSSNDPTKLRNAAAKAFVKRMGRPIRPPFCRLTRPPARQVRCSPPACGRTSRPTRPCSTRPSTSPPSRAAEPRSTRPCSMPARCWRPPARATPGR